ncbi:LysM peptidoglycan-binding domain-containing protein [Hymenobacter guriensis]|uniref:LysM peptidoglycan-binding domain-containing protein n=1 Tax=Hymenobacter guriensis TaxID=2793065 RepID=A0ABS0KXX4_9BACT|nr:LysM peptidoglycan-binding domain-containing protein [Hymenobacter guriensis]MBG8552727.1 LysM peptidoglycan-binding domain-containing protein [Hymenobacter guriensis]
MKRLVLFLLCVLPLVAGAQSVSVPAELAFAGLKLRLTPGGRTVLQQKVDALRRHSASFQARVALADAYFPIIDRVLQEKGVPLDFHFLAIQESGLQGDAQSIHDAVGYWQFKRESAQDYGLVMNDVVDERKHITASTRAAAQYLTRSKQQYRNWLSALLTYNLGASGAKPYTLPTDAGATSMEISEQTHPYILTFLAHKVAYEPACGLNPKPALLLQEFPAAPGQSLAAVAATLHASPEEVARHNRWLLAGTAVPTDRAYTLVVPITDPLQLTALAGQQKEAATALVHAPKPDPENVEFVRVNGLRALVALPGDTKETLARRANLKVRRLMQYNDLFAFDNIVPGQAYFVQRKRDKADVEYHVAQAGESVATVSQKYGVRAKAIWHKNRMARNEELKAGRLLWLQHTRPREVAVEYLPVNNPAALAAFERPHGAATPAPEPAATKSAPAAKPAPSRPAEADVYAGRTAAGQRILDDNENAEEEDSVKRKGLGRLLKKPAARPASASAETPPTAAQPEPADTEAAPTAAATSAPTTPAKAVYTGRPATQPASTPLADEPQQPASEPTVAQAPATASPAAPAAAAASPVASAAPTKTATPASGPVTAAPVQTTPIQMPAAPAPTAAAPASTASAPVAPAASAASALPATTVEPIPASGLHVVQPKETLYGVARRYNLRPADLIAWNSLPASPALRIGQSLRVTAPAEVAPVAAAPEAAATPEAEPIRHTVAAKESMYGIARKYGVTVQQLQEWNNKADASLKLGEVLLIKAAK